MSENVLQQQAHRLVEALPDDATWEDLIYRIYVREAIEAGIQDADAGRVVEVSDVRAEFGFKGRASEATDETRIYTDEFLSV